MPLGIYCIIISRHKLHGGNSHNILEYQVGDEYDDYEDLVCKDSNGDDDNVDGQSNEATQEGFN